MGVDVVFKVRPDPALTPKEYEALRQRFYEAYPDETEGAYHRFPSMEWDKYEPKPTIEVQCLDRFYGIGYERGHWPVIRELGNWLDVNVPGELRYGGDHADEWEYLTTWSTVVIDLDRHWDEHGNEPYRRGL